MKRLVVIWVTVLAVVVVLAYVIGLAFVVMPVQFHLWDTREFLVNEVPLEPVREDAFALIRKHEGDPVFLMADDQRVPESFKAIHLNYIVIDGNYVRLEFGGGF